MFPFAFEWQWDLGHLVFFGLLFLALGVLGLSLAYAFFMTQLDLWLGRTSASQDHHDAGEAGHGA